MKKILLAFSIPAIIYAQSMPELFNALKQHSQTRSDEILVKKSEVYKNLASSQLYPTINLFASYDNYNKPTGLVPVPPNDLLAMVKETTVGQPFSENIYKAGANFSMPIFVKSIFTTAKKAEALQKSARAKKHINLLKNEAILVGANANFLYLVALEKSLDAKRISLLETMKTVQIKVDNGRAAASSLYKINDGLNQIAIEKNNIELQKKTLVKSVNTLTGIVLEKPIPMNRVNSYEKGDLASLQPLREKLYADRLDIQVEKEKLYPALFAHGSYAFSRANAYNNDKTVNEEYANIGITLNIPLLAMNQYENINLSKVQTHASEVALEKSTDELNAQARMLEDSLPLLENSKELYKKSIKDKQKLLQIAKLNYTTGRLTTEEYLRYEDDVVSEKAKFYKTEAIVWQTQMQLAVIYANDIEEMVR